MSAADKGNSESALSGANLEYLEEQLGKFESEPSSLSDSWRQLFTNGLGSTVSSSASAAGTTDARQLSVSRMIDAFRLLGNRIADIDPLEIDERPGHVSLEMGSYGLQLDDLEQEFSSDIPGLERGTLRQIIDYLRDTYCGHISAEFMHITDPEERQWFIRNYEGTRGNPSCDKEHKLRLLERLVAADMLEKYLNTRFTGQKRFSLEGGDILVSFMDDVMRGAASGGCKEACIGMAHRGRLNLLINLMGKNPSTLFEEFEGKHAVESYGSGDVKYHMGFSSNLNFAGNQMHMAMGFNPSHLEIVNPVIEGSVWARQARRGDTIGNDVLPILIHGDAALAGQGIGMETLNMSQTRGYSTGGTLHVVVNNQVGFTTSDIRDARSTYWCTDLAKMAECPVLHVNGNDPEAGALAVRLALAYRHKFHKDIFIDLVCFRRHGHNEQDEPKVTQPYMYTKINKLQSPATHYAQKLVEEGVCESDTEQKLRDDYVALLEKGQPANSLVEVAKSSEFIDWSKYASDKYEWDDPSFKTAIKKADFSKFGEHLTTVPEGFTPHARVKKIIQNRAEMVAGKQPVDWGMAENMAYASLLKDDFGVRVSGQDVGRGTFFHRHAVWHNQGRSGRDGDTWIPLANLADSQPRIEIIDSLLSEAAVLGFEYGVSLTNPEMLVVWEAQFGDFANSAQVVIDQFISSGEYKWGRLSGLVMFLPHGYEGQGPEHSSARLERYMQLCAEYNMQVCVPTTAAQVFHLLRRQMVRPLRRPLIVLSPKSMLRHKEVASPISDFTRGEFHPLIAEVDSGIKPNKVDRVVVCCGKIYYELRAARAERKLNNVAILRLEQLYPFPHKMFKDAMSAYKNVKTVVWCQEEPGNQGAWHRVQHYLRRHINKAELRYSLRASSASTATGRASTHRQQQAEIVDVALEGVKK